MSAPAVLPKNWRGLTPEQMTARLLSIPESEREAAFSRLEVALGLHSTSDCGDWQRWLQVHFPHVTTAPFAPRHLRLWEWFERLTSGEKPRPRVEIWPRGGAKSSSAELACVRLGVRLARRFVLYVSYTQDLADSHVATIAGLFERLGESRAVSVYGHSKGWRRNQLRTARGFNVAAFGLDAGARGIKLDEFRPDCLILDDVDERHDTEATIERKMSILTNSLLPAGSSDCAVLFLQNLIHAESIAARLADGRADFLHDREPAEIEKAVEGLQVEQREQPDGTLRYQVTGGQPTWEGQDLGVCEAQINTWGLRAFLRESQQEVDQEEGGLWNRDLLARTRWTGVPGPLLRIGVGVDPNVSEGGDAAGIVVAGVVLQGGVRHGAVLEDATVAGGPKQWAEAAVTAYRKWGADVLVAEKNNGGEMVALTIQSVTGAPPVKLVHASRGKLTRAEPVQKLYDDGRFHHIGQFGLLETELCRYRAGMPSPNRMDALVWIGTELMLEAENPAAGFGLVSAGLSGWNP